MPPPADFTAFVDARWPALVRYAYGLTGDHGHAEDLVQHALERCWRHWRQVRAETAEAYVRTAIARLAVSRWRRRRFTETALTGVEQRCACDDHGQLLLRDAVWRELAALPPRMRAVVVLRFVEDLSEAETADILDCSVGNVKSQSSRALAKLRANPMLADLDLDLDRDLDSGRRPTRQPEQEGRRR